ncbi:MAG: phage holin family protein [Ktedonobacterales bacterium]
MGGFLRRSAREIIVTILVNAVAIVLTAWLLPGIHISSNGMVSGVTDFIILGVVFGLVNGFLKPIIKLISLPITILTLGLFQLVINALLLELVSLIVPSLHIDNFWWAVLGGLIMGIIAGILEWIARRVFPETKRNYRYRGQPQ